MDLLFAKGVASHFAYPGALVSFIPYGNGHINDTFRLFSGGDYILQRLNPTVFPHADWVMENLDLLLAYLQRELAKERAEGKLLHERPLSLIKTKEGASFYIDSQGAYWRSFPFLKGGYSLEKPRTEEDLYQAGNAFGRFLYDFRDFPLDQLKETLPHFHDTPKRYEDLLRAVNADPCHRLKDVQKEVTFYRSHQNDYSRITSPLAEGKIPYRISHNDTKINNLLYDEETNEAVTLLDLDTVMKGSSLYDFGDAARAACNPADEDEKDCRLIRFSLPYFQALLKGYLHGSEALLSPEEIALLPVSVLLLSLELGMRFLSDYLTGDHYMKISYPEHNLVRARVQIALAQDIKRKLPAMERLLKELNAR